MSPIIFHAKYDDIPFIRQIFRKNVAIVPLKSLESSKVMPSMLVQAGPNVPADGANTIKIGTDSAWEHGQRTYKLIGFSDFGEGDVPSLLPSLFCCAQLRLQRPYSPR